MAVKDFDWLGNSFGTATDNLRAKAGSKVEETIKEWLIERREVAWEKLDEPKGSNPARDSNATGALRTSVGWKPLVTNGEEVLLEIIAEDYWDRINSGVNGTKKSFGSKYSFSQLDFNNSFQRDISTWIRDRGIQPREPQMSHEQLSYVISRAVIRNGVMPVHFMDEAFSEEAIKELAERLGKTVKRIFE